MGNSKRILVANRGEIALRIMHAARELGHIPLAIYSQADRRSMHVAKAEEAYCVGEGPSPRSYLNIEAVMAAAEEMKADAIHPGYGFLSENGEFARAVEKAGMIFIGPPADVIDTMGNKVAARNAMAKVGLPLVPGTTQGTTDEMEALKAAREIGFPVMIKAVAGGGGRGMRLVESEDQFESSFKRATSEALKAFGDGNMYVERFIRSPHHIEVQIIGDKFGNMRHLYERECSVQRRHQKVIEEAPSPFISQKTRESICQAAVDACKKIGYVNAGTIEFLADDDQSYYFMEMNTRLQVEHPVTEAITGLDLAREQIRIAFGEEISFSQEDVKINGHAFEFRIYAEDPERFLPQAGKITGVAFPRGGGIRIDSHVYRGYEVPVFYDSMIAKITVWGRNRQEALEKARVAIADTKVNGIRTNVPVHVQLLESPKFVEGNYTTKLIGTDFNYKAPRPEAEKLKMAMMAVAVSAFKQEFKSGQQTIDDNSRWKAMGRVEAVKRI